MNKQAVGPRKKLSVDTLSGSRLLMEAVTNATRKNSMELRMDDQVGPRKNSMAATACEGEVTGETGSSNFPLECHSKHLCSQLNS